MTCEKLEHAKNTFLLEYQTETQDISVEAAIEYLKRKHRLSHPEGEFDGGGRFCLSDDERQICCLSIRTPSRSYPYSEMTHGRSLTHVAKLYKVDALVVRRISKRLEELTGALT